MKIYTILLLLLSSSIGLAQHSLEGIVLDIDTGEPVIGATVNIPKTEKAGITDFDGRFELQNLSEGKHRLVITSLGFASLTLDVTLPLEDELEILLSPTAIEMEEVIISTPFHQLQSENVMMVERSTMDDLSKMGSLSLSEGITQMAGVESITTGAGIGKPVIRGLSSNRVLVYTQGVRMENQQFGGEHGLGVSSSGIESVEVIKGPASLLYGSDALGGVLYLNPERYAPENSTELDAGATYNGNTLGLQANAGVKASADRFKFLLRGNYAAHSDYETGSGQRVTNSRFDELDIKSGIGYRDNSYKADLRYNLNSSETGIPTGLGSSTEKKVLEPYQEVQNHVLSLDNTFYFNSSSLDVKVGYLLNDRKEFEDHHHHATEENEPGEEEHEEHHSEAEEHGEEAALHMELSTLNYDAKYHLPKKGNLETIIGVQGMFQSNRNYGEELLIPDATTTDIGIMATTHLHLEKIDLQAGIRFDNRQLESDPMPTATGNMVEGLNRNFNSYNGALGIKFDLFPEITSRLNLATGFRAPNLAELTSHGSHHGSNRYEIGNAHLKNERNYQLDLALEWRTDHFEIFSNAFYNRINDYIYLSPTGAVLEDNPVFEYLQNDAALYGGESGIHIHPHPIDWLHVESSYEMVIGKRSDGEYLPLIPAHSILNTLRLEFEETNGFLNSYAFARVKTTFKQSRVNTFEETTDGYSLLDAGFGGSFLWNATELELRLSGNNLLNKSYISHLSRLKVDGIENMGRNISVSVKAIF